MSAPRAKHETKKRKSPKRIILTEKGFRSQALPSSLTSTPTFVSPFIQQIFTSRLADSDSVSLPLTQAGNNDEVLSSP